MLKAVKNGACVALTRVAMLKGMQRIVQILMLEEEVVEKGSR